MEKKDFVSAMERIIESEDAFCNLEDAIQKVSDGCHKPIISKHIDICMDVMRLAMNVMRFVLTHGDRVFYVFEHDKHADYIRTFVLLRALVYIRGLVSIWMLYVLARGDKVFYFLVCILESMIGYSREYKILCLRVSKRITSISKLICIYKLIRVNKLILKCILSYSRM